MTSSEPSRTVNRVIHPYTKMALVAIAMLLIGLASHAAQAQTFTVLHNFTNGADGSNPYSGVTIPQAGRLYGTTRSDSTGNGTVFRMTRQGSGWTFAPLFRFDGSNGTWPEARVVFGPDGQLYGTTEDGGGFGVFGVVYSLRPPAQACPSLFCEWGQSILARLATASDGNFFDYGDLIFDPDDNIYGTVETGGSTCIGGPGGGSGPEGNVYQLTKSGQSWTKKIIYNFENPSAGAQPTSGVIRDAAGNLYGTTEACGDPQCNHGGTVFELTSQQGTCWSEQTLHAFAVDGSEGRAPIAGLVADGAGNMYGATIAKGPNGGGTIFELSPSQGGWSFQVLYALSGSGYTPGPWRNLALDAAGNLYGTTYSEGAFGYGSIFKLTQENGSWTYTSLHDFSGGNDGGYPLSNVSMDANGNLFGTASAGGSSTNCAGGCGVVWEVTP